MKKLAFFLACMSVCASTSEFEIEKKPKNASSIAQLREQCCIGLAEVSKELARLDQIKGKTQISIITTIESALTSENSGLLAKGTRVKLENCVEEIRKVKVLIQQLQHQLQTIEQLLQ